MTKKQIAGILKRNGCRWKNKRLQNLFRSLQNDPKSAFYTANKITKSLLKKAKMCPYNKDDVFVKLYEQIEN